MSGAGAAAVPQFREIGAFPLKKAGRTGKGTVNGGVASIGRDQRQPPPPHKDAIAYQLLQQSARVFTRVGQENPGVNRVDSCLDAAGKRLFLNKHWTNACWAA